MKEIFVKQHDATDCAAACLAMVSLRFYKGFGGNKITSKFPNFQ
jgi:ABC-type bacteriocin/lantibiotic exporter with double-glycine peptidase domain